MDNGVIKPPDLPPIDECVITEQPLPHGTIFHRYQFKLPTDAPFLNGILSFPPKADRDRPAYIAGYARFSDGRPLCLRSLVFFCDAILPAAFNKTSIHTWIPTYTYHVQFWNRPTEIEKNEGWLKFEFKTPVINNGMCMEVGQLWDSSESNRLLATVTQVARILEPLHK